MNDNIPKWTQIELNDLPTYSDWPDKMFGEIDWTIPDRNVKKVLEEYDEEKYNELYQFKEEENIEDPREIKRKQLLGRSWQFASIEEDEPHTIVSRHEQLYLASVLEAQWYNDKIITKVFDDFLTGSETVIESGAGYGYNLYSLSESFSDCEFIGGELSQNAVDLGRDIYQDQKNIKLEKFNYYDENYDILDAQSNENVVLFTRLSIEQLPQCQQVIDNLLDYKNSLDEIIHFEPVYEMCDTNKLLGLLRRKYIDINDYNKDLLSVLCNHDEAIIKNSDYDLFSDNCLCPMSLIQWEPK
jgi:hypothetical protein